MRQGKEGGRERGGRREAGSSCNTTLPLLLSKNKGTGRGESDGLTEERERERERGVSARDKVGVEERRGDWISCLPLDPRGCRQNVCLHGLPICSSSLSLPDARSIARSIGWRDQGRCVGAQMLSMSSDSSPETSPNSMMLSSSSSSPGKATFSLIFAYSGNSPYDLRLRASSGLYLRITSAFASW